MRITGGKYKGRIVRCPKGIIRPSMDRMRESMFSILGPIEKLAFLDLFSGSGIVGLEAASRGASVVCVEKDIKKKAILKENLQISADPIKLYIMPVERYIRTSKEAFDIIFCDPPFAYKRKKELLDDIGNRPIRENGCRIVIHLPREETITNNIGRLTLNDRREYGGSVLLFFVNRDSTNFRSDG